MTTVLDQVVSETDKAVEELAHAKREVRRTEHLLEQIQEEFAAAKTRERRASEALAMEMERRVDFAIKDFVDGAPPS